MDSGRPILTPLGDINAIFMHFPFDMVLLQALPDLPQAQTGIFFGIKLAVHPGDTPRQFVSRHIFRSIYHVPEGITAPVHIGQTASRLHLLKQSRSGKGRQNGKASGIETVIQCETQRIFKNSGGVVIRTEHK